MFTGIIESVGSVSEISPKGEDFCMALHVADLDMSDVKLGDSIAVNGVCLTVIDLKEKQFSADVSAETIRHTSLSQLKQGAPVNLEKALTPSSRLGGHLVSGHVDGLGKVVNSFPDGRATRYVIEAPKELSRYIAAKGSICVDGISLTVNEVKGDQFYLNIVPHTADKTNVGTWEVGTQLNLEVDVIARYLERLLSGSVNDGASPYSESSRITEGFLAEHGFLKGQ